MIAQDRYMTVYAAKQIERPLNCIIGGPSPKIRLTKGSLLKQAQKIVYEEYSKAPPNLAAEDITKDDADY